MFMTDAGDLVGDIVVGKITDEKTTPVEALSLRQRVRRLSFDYVLSRRTNAVVAYFS